MISSLSWVPRGAAAVEPIVESMIDGPENSHNDNHLNDQEMQTSDQSDIINKYGIDKYDDDAEETISGVPLSAFGVNDLTFF